MTLASSAPPSTAPTTERQEKGLKAGALGLISSTVVGVASTAPAYSLAATLGFVVAAIGLQAPAVTVIAFIPMLFIAYGYKEMNNADPDCGTTFTWGVRAFGPRRRGGWAAGRSSPPTCWSWPAWPRSPGSTSSSSSTPTGSAIDPAAAGCCWSASSGSWP